MSSERLALLWPPEPKDETVRSELDPVLTAERARVQHVAMDALNSLRDAASGWGDLAAGIAETIAAVRRQADVHTRAYDIVATQLIEARREILATRRLADQFERRLVHLESVNTQHVQTIATLASANAAMQVRLFAAGSEADHSKGASPAPPVTPVLSATAKPVERYRSPASALEPWELSGEAVQVLRQIVDPSSPLGKAVDLGAPVRRADASVIRRRRS